MFRLPYPEYSGTVTLLLFPNHDRRTVFFDRVSVREESRRLGQSARTRGRRQDAFLGHAILRYLAVSGGGKLQRHDLKFVRQRGKCLREDVLRNVQYEEYVRTARGQGRVVRTQRRV